jgi:hypothetical protein
VLLCVCWITAFLVLVGTCFVLPFTRCDGDGFLVKLGLRWLALYSSCWASTRSFRVLFVGVLVLCVGGLEVGVGIRVGVRRVRELGLCKILGD